MRLHPYQQRLLEDIRRVEQAGSRRIIITTSSHRSVKSTFAELQAILLSEAMAQEAIVESQNEPNLHQVINTSTNPCSEIYAASPFGAMEQILDENEEGQALAASEHDETIAPLASTPRSGRNPYYDAMTGQQYGSIRGAMQHTVMLDERASSPEPKPREQEAPRAKRELNL